MKRREFIEGLALSVALVPAGASVLSGCGDDGGPGDPDPDAGPTDGGSCGDGDGVGNSDSHGHTLTITRAQIDAGVAIAVPAAGGGHPHTVNLTPAQLATLDDSCTVTVTSNDSHAHTWVVDVV